ncbi:LysR family transcriptional regulator [Actibacterium ureilyticum]|uniref:LysR family transcriptional regulator n=1 Tax=Actibacterium ureilyticum TaxID=1590614 RepID=UPI000BAABEAF|nr:LysR family transcriptional regulator [Actibacterium ureilyticum]
MNLRALDLNLLVILDALLDEGHVSRAAVRLNLSQPAVSNALQRCRDLLGDPLLERGRGGMVRTPRAEALRLPLRAVLSDIATLVDPPAPDLATMQQVVRITAADDPTALLAPVLAARLSETAPGITVVFRPWQGPQRALRALRDGDTDLAISVFDRTAEQIETVTLLRADYVVAMRHDHPAGTSLDLDGWLRWPHVIVSGQGAQRTPLDAQLARIGRKRRVALVVPSFHLVPPILRATDFVAMLPRQGLWATGRTDLTTHAPPIAVDGFPLHLAWHRRRSQDPGIRHVAELVRSAMA